MEQTFTVEQGWNIEIRPDLGGVVVSRKTDDETKKSGAEWIPFANCRNGTPVEVPQKAGK